MLAIVLSIIALALSCFSWGYNVGKESKQDTN